LPYALSRILNQVTSVTSAHGAPSATFAALQWPLALFALLCAGELLFGRVSSSIQLRVTPRQRQYVARAWLRHWHGLSTIADLDRILVFSAGEIGEDGTHQALLDHRGQHHRLWTRQSCGLLPEGLEDTQDVAE
jgi:hypothetical protein